MARKRNKNRKTNAENSSPEVETSLKIQPDYLNSPTDTDSTTNGILKALEAVSAVGSVETFEATVDFSKDTYGYGSENAENSVFREAADEYDLPVEESITTFSNKDSEEVFEDSADISEPLPTSVVEPEKASEVAVDFSADVRCYSSQKTESAVRIEAPADTYLGTSDKNLDDLFEQWTVHSDHYAEKNNTNVLNNAMSFLQDVLDITRTKGSVFYTSVTQHREDRLSKAIRTLESALAVQNLAKGISEAGAGITSEDSFSGEGTAERHCEDLPVVEVPAQTSAEEGKDFDESTTAKNTKKKKKHKTKKNQPKCNVTQNDKDAAEKGLPPTSSSSAADGFPIVISKEEYCQLLELDKDQQLTEKQQDQLNWIHAFADRVTIFDDNGSKMTINELLAGVVMEVDNKVEGRMQKKRDQGQSAEVTVEDIASVFRTALNNIHPKLSPTKTVTFIDFINTQVRVTPKGTISLSNSEMKKGAKAAQKDAKVQQEEKRRRGSLTDNSLGTSSSSISSDEIPVTAKETMTMTEPMDENKAISRQEQEKLLTALVGYGIAGTGLHDVEKDKVGQYNPTDDNGKKMLLYSAVVGDLMINYEYTDPTVSVSRFQPSFFEEWVDVRQNGLMFKNFKLIGKTPPPQVIRLCQLILNGENHLLGTYLPTSQPGTWEYSSFPRQRMIESILGCLVFAPNNFTIIHFLSAEWSPRRHPKMTCNETHHSNCKLLQILFNSIPAELVKEWISRQETAKGRTALHYIAMFGSTCVLDVFKPYLDNKMLNCEDFSKISPLLYAVIGNNFPVMRWLMTNGCDMSFSAIGRTALDKSAERQKCLGWPYVNNRLKALDRCMNAWIGYGYEDQFKLMGAVSDISTMYLTQAREKIDLNIQIREKNMRTALALGEVSLVMFAVPVSYSDWEPYMPDKYPHIMRTKLTDRNGQVTNIFKSVLLIDSSTTVLKSTQNNFDVGMYAWFLSKNVVTNDPSIAMDVDMSYVKNFFNQIIFVQIFAVKVVSAPPVAGPMKSGKKEKTD